MKNLLSLNVYKGKRSRSSYMQLDKRTSASLKLLNYFFFDVNKKLTHKLNIHANQKI